MGRGSKSVLKKKPRNVKTSDTTSGPVASTDIAAATQNEPTGNITTPDYAKVTPFLELQLVNQSGGGCFGVSISADYLTS